LFQLLIAWRFLELEQMRGKTVKQRNWPRAVPIRGGGCALVHIFSRFLNEQGATAGCGRPGL
jgi:hypothetical protein